MPTRFLTSRIQEAEKRYLTNPSFACALLKAIPEKLLADLNKFGQVRHPAPSFILWQKSICIILTRIFGLYNLSIVTAFYFIKNENGQRKLKTRERKRPFQNPGAAWYYFENGAGKL
jgi:hypothetical protein